jgi:hypothetical protein
MCDARKTIHIISQPKTIGGGWDEAYDNHFKGQIAQWGGLAFFNWWRRDEKFNGIDMHL